jgi:hypothetical protein
MSWRLRMMGRVLGSFAKGIVKGSAERPSVVP